MAGTANFNGNDVINGNAGTDTLLLVASANVTVAATAGLTNVEVIALDTTAGTTGVVTVTTHNNNVASGQTLTLNASALTTGTLSFNGSAEADGAFSITGGGAGDTITGGAGNDTLSGGAGADSLVGGGGADSILGGAGNDTISGGTGNDTVDGGDGNDHITMQDAGDSLDGGAGTDTLVIVSPLTGATTVVDFSVSAGTDQVTQFAGVLNGSVNQINFENVDASALQGSLNFTAGSAATQVIGGTGGDQILGGAGNDTIIGGDGGDQLTGGGGTDYFVYRAATDGADAGSVLAGTYDTITDFTVGTDKIAFGGALYTALDDDGNSSLAVGTTDVHINTTAQEVFVSTVAVSDAQLTETGFATILTNVFGTLTNDMAGIEFAIIVHGATQSGIYLFQAANNDHAATADEITLLGIIQNSAAVGTGDILTTTV